MASGGKGGSQSTRVELPGFINEAAQRAVSQGQRAGEIGYIPYSGPDVAAFTPTQEAAFAGTNAAAGAFGLPQAAASGLPAPQEFAGGLLGYSSRPLFDEQMAVLAQERPGQLDAINSFFIDPVTGAPPVSLPRPAAAGVAGPAAIMGGGDEGDALSGGFGGFGGSGGGIGDYTGIRDMFDGGGPGRSGDRYEGGGLISDIGNRVSDRNDERRGGGGLLGGLVG